MLFRMAESKKNNANKLYAAKDYKSALKEYNQVIGKPIARLV